MLSEWRKQRRCNCTADLSLCFCIGKTPGFFSSAVLDAVAYGNDFCYFVETMLLQYFVHHENLPMQYTEIFKVIKNIKKNHSKKFDIFLIFAQNIECGYTLEPPCRGGSNEYPQSMFWSKNKKNRYSPPYPSFAI